MNKPFTHDQTIHPLPNCSSVTKPFDHDQTSIHRFNVIWLILVVENLSFAYLYVVFRWPSVLLVPLVGCHLWLWHFLRTRYHYSTIWGLSMIVALPGDFLYDTSWESMIVALPGDSLWLWHFLGTHSDCGTSWGLYDCDTSWGPVMIVACPGNSMIVALLRNSVIVALPGDSIIAMIVGVYDCGISWGPTLIVTLPGDSLWLWHFLGTHSDCDTSWRLYDCDTSWGLYDCDTSWGPVMIVACPGNSMIVALLRNSVIVALPGDSIIFVCLFVLRLNVPVNNFSVMSGWSHRFLGN